VLRGVVDLLRRFGGPDVHGSLRALSGVPADKGLILALPFAFGKEVF
jgi:hypothetical protein